MDVKELAEYLHLKRGAVYRLAQQGSIPVERVGGRWRFQKEAVDGWLARRRPRRTRQETGAPARETVPAKMEEGLGLALERLIEFSGMEMGTLLLAVPEGLKIALSRGAGQDFLRAEAVVPPGECLCGRAAMGETVLSPDVRKDPRATRPGCRESGFRGRLCLPLVGRDGALGVVTLGSRHPLANGTPLKAVQGFADLLGLLWESLLLQEQAQALADTDPLTGLSNRRRFWSELEREVAWARRYGRPLSLVVMDVDNLKEINDSYGHQTGDQLLKEVATISRAGVRASDLPCRYGGDEFVLLLPEAKKADALAVAQRISKLVSACDFQAGETRVPASLSLGIASYPEDAATPEELFEKADRAMLRAKDSATRIAQAQGQAGEDAAAG